MGRRFRKDRFSKSWWGDKPYWYRRSKNGGVIGNSRVVPHRYMDEGDKGKAHRREIRRKEERLWRKEIDMRFDLGNLGITFRHPKHDKVTPGWWESVWHVEYPNGWARRAVMDHNGSVIFVRWIPPGRVT